VTMAESISPEMTDWLDGPRLAEWLRANGLESAKRQLGPTLERAYGRWRAGGKASVYVLDQMLVKLHLHLSDVPDDLWVAWCPAVPTRQKVITLILSGMGPAAVARRLGVDPKTVREHRRRAGLA
jgi:hypothetical protein